MEGTVQALIEMVVTIVMIGNTDPVEENLTTGGRVMKDGVIDMTITAIMTAQRGIA